MGLGYAIKILDMLQDSYGDWCAGDFIDKKLNRAGVFSKIIWESPYKYFRNQLDFSHTLLKKKVFQLFEVFNSGLDGIPT